MISELMENLNIKSSDSAASILEKLFCAALIPEGTDVIARVTGRFIELRKQVQQDADDLPF